MWARRKAFSIICLVFVLAALFFVTVYSAINQQANRLPLVEKGTMDLGNWNISKQGMVKLDGEWEFYWKELLSPIDFHENNYVPNYIDIPSSWNGYKHGNEELKGSGYATFRIRLDKGSQNQNLALKVPYMSTAYKMWVNGQLVASNGKVATSRENMLPQFLPKVVSLDAENDIEIIVQVSNFMHRKGGIWNSIYLGTIDQIANMDKNLLLIKVFLIGGLLVLGIYHLLFYLIRKKDKSLLYFALICFLSSLYSMLMGESLLIQHFPDFNWVLAMKSEYLCYYLNVFLMVLFVKSLFPNEFNKKILSFTKVITVFFVSVVVFTTSQLYTQFNVLYQIINIVIAMYLLYVLIRAVINRRKGALIALIGTTVLITVVINDILYYDEVLTSTSLGAFGLLVFALSYSCIMAYRISAAFSRAERLSDENALIMGEIKEANRNLEQRVRERTIELRSTIAKLNVEIQEHQETEEMLTLYATTDMMTGALNRVTGMAFLEKQFQLSRRNHWYLTICFIDINNLKQVNDIYGHLAGDELIILVSKVIKDSIRGSDTLCRLGGDEFLLIFSQCAIKQAELIWDRISGRIDELNLTASRPYPVKLSHGFAELMPGITTSVEELIETADQAMYKEKKAGKLIG